MQACILPSQELLLELFEYRDGKIFWRKSGRGRNFVQEAGYLDDDGYRRVRIKGKRYQTHRIIWVMCNGEIPEGIEIDHIDGHRDDNRIEFLRLANHAENGRNCKTPSTNTSGHKGVSWCKSAGKWLAYIMVNRKSIHLGLFEKLEEAVAVRKQAEMDYHKDFRRS